MAHSSEPWPGLEEEGETLTVQEWFSLQRECLASPPDPTPSDGEITETDKVIQVLQLIIPLLGGVLGATAQPHIPR